MILFFLVKLVLEKPESPVWIFDVNKPAGSCSFFFSLGILLAIFFSFLPHEPLLQFELLCPIGHRPVCYTIFCLCVDQMLFWMICCLLWLLTSWVLSLASLSHLWDVLKYLKRYQYQIMHIHSGYFPFSCTDNNFLMLTKSRYESNLEWKWYSGWGEGRRIKI